MKTKILTTFIMLYVGIALFAQEFSTKLYFETASGSKDTIEIGYDPGATWFEDPSFGEVNYGSSDSPDKFQVFVIDPGWGGYDCGTEGIESPFFLKKQIINKDNSYNDITNKIIAIIIPVDSLPVTVSWDNTHFQNRGDSFITDNPFWWKMYPWAYMFPPSENVWDYTMEKNLAQNSSLTFSTISSDKKEEIKNLFYPSSYNPDFYVIYVGFFNPTAVGEEEIRIDNRFSVFPNPIQNNCYITSSTDQLKHIQITTLSGQKIISVNGDISVIDCQLLPTGIYIMMIETKDGRKGYNKIIKK